MTKPSLPNLLRQHFPTASFNENAPDLAVGSFPEWDSLAHFNLLLLIEETYGIRFSVDEMTAIKTVADIDKTLREKNAA